MKHTIIGTAGHVDHGKTTLVKALTGIDTDRLEEEKRRGVTIELGFAYIDFEDGSRVGVIDVPGHERFIRNMLAGAGSIDLAMLIVAADEGVMPQTREHLGILIQLGISDGVVVVTKTDKADADWLELVYDDIAELVKGTFLDGKQVLPVSAYSNEGISELKSAIYERISNMGEKDMSVPFRLPVDRVFPVDGFGIVVTGTLIEGSVKVGDTAEILPSGEKAPVRNIQVHGENADSAYAGQRTAISLGGVKRGGTVRGDVIAATGAINVTSAIDVKLSVLPDSGRIIKTGSEHHLFHGTRTLLAKVILIDKKELIGGESCYARVKLREPLPCKRNDRFVLRFLSPLETIGGGVILDTQPNERLKRSKQTLDALIIREQGSASAIAELASTEIGGVFSEADLCKRADFDKRTCSAEISKLITEEKLIQLLPDKFISVEVLNLLSVKCKEILESYHEQNPLRTGIDIAELRQKLMPETDTTAANRVLGALSDNKVITLSGNVASLPEHEIKWTPAQQKIHDKIRKELIDARYDVPSPDEMAAGFAKNEKRDFEQVFESMLANGELKMLSKQVYWLGMKYDEAIELIKAHFHKNDNLTLAQCRDILKTSRKYALAFLEHLDGKQVTRMSGDVRVPAKGFDVLQRHKDFVADSQTIYN